MLHPVNHDTTRRLYCGPTAICTITGRPASEVLEVIERQRGFKAYNIAGQPKGVRSMSLSEMKHVLLLFGYSVVETLYGNKQPTTLAKLVDNWTFGTAVVLVTGHYVAIDGTMFCDTFTNQPVPLAKALSRRCKVWTMLQVFPATTFKL